MPPSLEELILHSGFGAPHKFTGGIPSEWGSLTNLKKLSMAFCGLDGASRGGATQHTATPRKPIATEANLMKPSARALTTAYNLASHRHHPARDRSAYKPDET